MPSVTYMNQSAPFWDFIASLEQQGNNSARENNNNNNNNNEENRGEGNEHHQEGPPFDPFGWGNFFGGRAFAHHGPPPHHHEEDFNEKDGEKDGEKNDEELRDNNDNDNGEGPSCNSGSDNEGHAGRRGHHGRCGGRRRGRCDRSGGPGPFGGPWGRGGRHGGPHRGGPWGWGAPHEGPHHGPGPHHGGPRGFGRRGGWDGPWGGRGHPFAAAFDPSTMLTNFISQFQHKPNDPSTETDHTPEADIFDTETSYVIHISLPGAKKEDVGVNWDAEKSELAIAGVIYRPGDEEFLKTLAMNERKVGPFERKIRLGTRATPAHIDVDGMSAKLEDGILRVEVPKLDSGYVEVRKVDIE